MTHKILGLYKEGLKECFFRLKYRRRGFRLEKELADINVRFDDDFEVQAPKEEDLETVDLNTSSELSPAITPRNGEDMLNVDTKI